MVWLFIFLWFCSGNVTVAAATSRQYRIFSILRAPSSRLSVSVRFLSINATGTSLFHAPRSAMAPISAIPNKRNWKFQFEMLTCIACPQHQLLDEEDVVATISNRKQSAKSLTCHIKNMAIKASGAYRSCKPWSGSENEKHNFRSYDDNSVSERPCSVYRRAGRSNSMARMKGISSGEGTPVSLSRRIESLIFMEEDEPKEWAARVEPGVLIIFVSMPQGGNHLKRIRFRKDNFGVVSGLRDGDILMT